MPRCKIEKSLKSLCLEKISSNLKFWCDSGSDDASSFSLVLGPFQDLPSALVQGILVTAAERKNLKKKYIPMLLGDNVQCLNLNTKKGYFNDVLDTDKMCMYVGKSCPNLRVLNLDGCYRIREKALNSTLMCLQKLQVLNLRNTYITEASIQVIADNCSDLRELDISDSNEDSSYFLQPFIEPTPNGEYPCPKLHSVSIDLKFPDMGKDFLEARKNIVKLDTSILFAILIEYIGDVWPKGDEKLLQLKEMNFTMDNMYFSDREISDTIVNLKRICKNVASMEITFDSELHYKLINQLMLNLEDLPHLHSCKFWLHEIPKESTEVIYKYGITNFLKTVGEQLTVLHLSFSKVCIKDVFTYCPNLKDFLLQPWSIEPHVDMPDKQKLEPSLYPKQLQKFDLRWTFFDNPLTSEDLCIDIEQIFSLSHNLEEFYFRNFSFDTAKLIETLSSLHLPKLSSVGFDCCGGITKEVALTILQGDNCMESFTLDKCKDMTAKCEKELIQYADKHGFMVDFNFEFNK